MIEFEVEHGNEGRFRLTEAQEGTMALNALLDRRDATDMIGKDYVEHLKRLLTKHPESIDIHAHLGMELMSHGLTQQGLNYARRGLRLGLTAMPKDFGGTLSWYDLGNRPFLRAAQTVALAQKELGKTDDAEKLMRQMLKWNPDDNQGVRFVLEEASSRPGL